MIRPPSSSPVAPDWPCADHRLHAFPAIVPLATSVALPVSAAAGPPDVAGFVGGEQSEIASGTLTIVIESVLAAAGEAELLARTTPAVAPAASTTATTAAVTAIRRLGRTGPGRHPARLPARQTPGGHTPRGRPEPASASAAMSPGGPRWSRISRTDASDSSVRSARAAATCSRSSSSSWLRRLLGSGARARLRHEK
jgi:hypothetical protein